MGAGAGDVRAAALSKCFREYVSSHVSKCSLAYVLCNSQSAVPGRCRYGEDPTLTKLLGAEVVQGIQGAHPRYLKVAASPKHFTVYDGPEEGRMSGE